MGIKPESSHHEEGPGQNEIDFRYTEALEAADNVMTFQTVVKTVARRNGLYADFSPKPLGDTPGNGFHINMSVKGAANDDVLYSMTAGILEKAVPMTTFLNPSESSYKRLGRMKAPKYVSWSRENRSQLIRIPAAQNEYRRLELRSPDPSANPYIAFAILIWAALDGITKSAKLPDPLNLNLYKADEESLASVKKLPENLKSAKAASVSDEFILKYIPAPIIYIYCAE